MSDHDNKSVPNAAQKVVEAAEKFPGLIRPMTEAEKLQALAVRNLVDGQAWSASKLSGILDRLDKLDQRDADREAQAKARLENLPILTAVLTNAESYMQGLADRLAKLEKAVNGEGMNNNLVTFKGILDRLTYLEMVDDYKRTGVYGEPQKQQPASASPWSTGQHIAANDPRVDASVFPYAGVEEPIRTILLDCQVEGRVDLFKLYKRVGQFIGKNQ